MQRMASTINSTIKLASGYEIPRLGFGVSDSQFDSVPQTN
jgi:hypothetical protein